MSENKLKSSLPFIAAALVAGGIVVFLIATKDYNKTARVDNPVSQPKTEEPKPAEPTFNKKLYSTDSPESLWVVVNKKRPLPAGFAPKDLTIIGGTSLQAEANKQAKQLIEDAKKDQVTLKVISGYRSYQTQKNLYASYVSKDGQAAADSYSARAGHSEHQTGLAADLGNASGACDLKICFETTAGGKWLAAHVYEYGFIISYAKGKEALTGYQFEPWHIRYIGKELAAELRRTGQTMEEFFGLASAPGY